MNPPSLLSSRRSTLAGFAVALVLTAGVPMTSLAAGLALGQSRDGRIYVSNQIQISLRADYAAELSETGPRRRPVDKLRLAGLHRWIKEVRAGQTAAERWMQGQPLPERVRHRAGQVPAIARSLTVDLKENVDAQDALAELQALPEVEWACLAVGHRVEATPDDPLFGPQWGLTKINAPDAWDVTPRTTSIDIAIVDTGVDLDHSDLAGIISYQRGFAGNSSGNHPPLRIEDAKNTASHGTHVAGIAAAIRNNGLHGAGVARAQIMAMGCAFWGGPFTDEYLIFFAWDAINDAVANGAEVINCSFGSGPDADLDPATASAVQNAEDNDVLVVCAAGNDGRRIAPGKSWDGHDHPFIISSTESDDQLAATSNFGDPIDLAAPGGGIVSTIVNGTARMSGTSMAAPHVAGAAALLISMNPSRIEANGVKHLLRRMSADIGSSDLFGSGRLNLGRPFVQVLHDADRFVQYRYPSNPFLVGDGDYETPIDSLANGIALADSGDTLVVEKPIVAGIYYPPITITKAVTLRAFPDAIVDIGRVP